MRKDLLPLVQAVLKGQYTIDRELARGGSGRIFLAHDPDGKAVALKVLHPELQVSVAADRFLREIKVLSGLDHPRITRLLDYGEADWVVYFVMEYEEGTTLRCHLDRVRQIPVADVVRLAEDLLDALGYAHDRGIVHRDVKPDNIVITDHGAMLLDFGIARAIEVAGSQRLTRSGFTVGTSTYMSPEQAAAFKGLDHRSDIYSLGCVLFECLAGKPPFSHHSEAVVLELHQREPPPDLTKLRKEAKALTPVLAKALAKLPPDRWQSASDMKAAILQATQAGQTLPG
ncbi:MAG: serine/threonine-protein kinase [Gemmatimonadales bacterium]